jgi:hypothetical protein
MLKTYLKWTFRLVLAFSIIAAISPIMAYVAFFLSLLGFGIFMIYKDNNPREGECSPIFKDTSK